MELALDVIFQLAMGIRPDQQLESVGDHFDGVDQAVLFGSGWILNFVGHKSRAATAAGGVLAAAAFLLVQLGAR